MHTVPTSHTSTMMTPAIVSQSTPSWTQDVQIIELRSGAPDCIKLKVPADGVSRKINWGKDDANPAVPCPGRRVSLHARLAAKQVWQLTRASTGFLTFIIKTSLWDSRATRTQGAKASDRRANTLGHGNSH